MTLRSILRKLSFFVAYHLYAKPRMMRTDRLTLFGLDFRVPPTVFHPGLYFSSKYLANFILTLPLKGMRVLDLGCGSGLLSLLAARRGASVVGIDFNEIAAASSRSNAQLNHLDAHAKFYHGDLFGPLAEELPFDFILLNPPFYSEDPKSVADHAWKAGSDLDFFKRISSLASAHLTPSGKIIYIISSDTDTSEIERQFQIQGFAVRELLKRKYWFETLFINEVSRAI